jgi:hypothetical protein
MARRCSRPKIRSALLFGCGQRLRHMSIRRLRSCDTAIKIILDNHSAHMSKETNKWLDEQRNGRFTIVFTPKHGSWFNLAECFLSMMAR